MKKIFVNPRMIIVEINDQEIVTQSLGYAGADCHSEDDEEAIANSRSRNHIWDD